MKENEIFRIVREVAIQKLERRKMKKRMREKFSEERRLFYVAMTRARKRILFLTVQEQESPFILELREEEELNTYYLD
jgi:hypothetical protein